MQSKLSFWRRINPMLFLFFLIVGTATAVYKIGHDPQSLGITVVVAAFGYLGIFYGFEKALHRLGENEPGKKFVAEVFVVHWRGETTRFWGVYRYEWVANFAARYLAYLLDHLGDVHWEFGIGFRVHDREKPKTAETDSGSEG